MEEAAAASGTLAATPGTCQGRDRTFDYNPAWKVRGPHSRWERGALIYGVSDHGDASADAASVRVTSNGVVGRRRPMGVGCHDRFNN